MPSLNVTFTDEEWATFRAAAATDDVSLSTFAHRAILAAASEHGRRVAEAARIVAMHSAELNRRLASNGQGRKTHHLRALVRPLIS